MPSEKSAGVDSSNLPAYTVEPSTMYCNYSHTGLNALLYEIKCHLYHFVIGIPPPPKVQTPKQKLKAAEKRAKQNLKQARKADKAARKAWAKAEKTEARFAKLEQTNELVRRYNELTNWILNNTATAHYSHVKKLSDKLDAIKVEEQVSKDAWATARQMSKSCQLCAH